ncbi:MAG: LytTR family DNA-binding domain-containing protein [Bacteroidota bacterium]
MKILIVEDEHHAQKRLSSIIKELRPNAEITEIFDSVEDTLAYLNSRPSVDLLFLDIQLSDGLSFEIFDETNIETPVIFTTAFDEYAIKAFKLNSVDYLLKPVDEAELEKAFTKFEKLYNRKDAPNIENIKKLISSFAPKEYQTRFLIKSGQQLNFINVEEIAYFFSENSLSFLVSKNKKKHIVEHTMDQLEKLVDPKLFYRINRKTIISISSIGKASAYFNSRLILQLNPAANFEVIVSREKVKEFKRWLGG